MGGGGAEGAVLAEGRYEKKKIHEVGLFFLVLPIRPYLSIFFKIDISNAMVPFSSKNFCLRIPGGLEHII